MNRLIYLPLLLILASALPADAARLSSRNFKRSLTPAPGGLGNRTRSLLQSDTPDPQKEMEASQNEEESEGEERVVKQFFFMGPNTGWGFVKQATPYFNESGKNLGTLPAGILIKYNGKKGTRKTSMLISTIQRGKSGNWEGPYLIDFMAIATYSGDPESIDPLQRLQLQRYFTLTGEIEEREKAIKEYSIKRNPHYQAAKRVQTEYLGFVQEVKKLEERMLSTSGLRRSELQNELRSKKYEQVKIRADLEKCQTAYRAWKREHPVDLKKIAARDPLSKRLHAERDQLLPHIRNLIPME